jgi:two-component system, NarL family, response regulator NreC
MSAADEGGRVPAVNCGEPGVPPGLTKRETEILKLLAQGKRNREVAAILGISIRTAENHRAKIRTKLGLSSMSDLVRYAIRNKIIEP